MKINHITMTFTNVTLGGASVYLIACRIVDMLFAWKEQQQKKKNVYAETMMLELDSEDINALKFFCDIFTPETFKQGYVELFVFGPKKWEKKEPWISPLDQINSLPLLAQTFSNRLDWAKRHLFNNVEDPQDVTFNGKSNDALLGFSQDVYDVWCQCDDTFVNRIKDAHQKALKVVEQNKQALEEKKKSEKLEEKKRVSDAPKKVFPPFVPGKQIPDSENPWKIRQAAAEAKAAKEADTKALDSADDVSNTDDVENVVTVDDTENNSDSEDNHSEVDDWKTVPKKKKKAQKTRFVQFDFGGKTHRVECILLPTGDFSPVDQKIQTKKSKA